MRTETPPASAPAHEPPPRRKHFRVVTIALALLFLAAGAYFGWREYDFRAAVRESKTVGIRFTYDDPFEAIKKDWRAIFSAATWSRGERFVCMQSGEKFVQLNPLFRRLRVRKLTVMDCKNFSNLESFNGLAHLEEFMIGGCVQLENIDALKDIEGLRGIGFRECPKLQTLDACRGLPNVEKAYFRKCTALKNMDALGGFTKLNTLNLEGCTALESIDAVRACSSLELVNLTGCTALKDIGALHGCAKLKTLKLDGCTNISWEAVKAIKAALPNTEVSPP